MKSIFFFSVVLTFCISCQQSAVKNEKRDTGQFIKQETEKWKKELSLNGEIGTPCEADYMKWNAKNPESYYGQPSEINSRIFDINGDGKDDLLLFFPAGESCTGGHEEGSDFVALIYSNGAEYLSNKNLRAKIENKIMEAFKIQTDTFARRAIFSITDFKQQILGTFQLWRDEDPDCCAGYEGMFTYNPFTWKIELKKHVKQ